jgi:hypothetical protein
VHQFGLSDPREYHRADFRADAASWLLELADGLGAQQHACRVLGLEQAADRDEVFRQLVLARQWLAASAGSSTAPRVLFSPHEQGSPQVRRLGVAR